MNEALFKKKLESLIVEALDIEDHKRRKRIVSELGVVLSTNFRSKETKSFVSDCNKLAKGKKVTPKRSEDGKGGPIGFVKYNVGEKVVPKQKPTSTDGNVVDDDGNLGPGKNGSEGDIIPNVTLDDGRQELIDIIAMTNEEVKVHFGGMRNMKKWGKLQGFQTNQGLAGDKYITPFKIEVEELLAKIKLQDEEEEE